MEKTKKTNIFAKFFNKINKFFKSLRPLVLMQLKDKVDFSFLKSKKKTLFKTIYSLIFFCALTAIIYLIFSLIVNLGLFSFLKILNFRAFLVIMTVLVLLSFASCLTNITKTLYFSKDNPVLLTMPVTTNELFTSKLLVVFIYELIKNTTYILPFLIAYGLVMKLSFAYFLWIILMLVFLTMFLVVVCGLFSIPAMAISIVLKKHKVIEWIFLALVVGFAVFGLIKLIGLIPANIDLVRDWGTIYWSVQDFLKNFAIIFFAFNSLTEFMTGMKFNTFSFNIAEQSNLFTFLIMLAIIVLGLVISYFLIKKLFLKMASSPFEYKKVIIKKEYTNKKTSPLLSCVKEETKKLFRNSGGLYSVLAVAIICPLAVFLQNQIVRAMDTRILGNYMLISFNILIILLIQLSSNINMASVYSKEGNSAYLNKVNPVKYAVPLTSKLIPQAVLCVVSIVASTIVISLYAHISVLNTILLALSLILVYIAHLFWSAELDIMNPQNQQYQTTGAHQKNPNELKSTIILFVTCLLFAFFTFFLIKENVNVVFVKLLFISLLYAFIRIYLFYTRVSLYYKEK